MNTKIERILAGILWLSIYFISAPANASLNWSAVYGVQNTGADGDTYTSNYYGNNKLQLASIGQWSGGLGVYNYLGSDPNTVPNHSTDNSGPEDMILFVFDQAVSIDEITIGWPSSGYDTDISVLAYTDGGNPISLGSSSQVADYLSNKTYDENDALGGNTVGLTNAGWSFIGHYANLTANFARDISADTAGVSSSYWLIGALNPFVSATSMSADNDYVKIASLGGTITPPDSPAPPASVPTPGTLVLLGMGLTLVGCARKRTAN